MADPIDRMSKRESVLIIIPAFKNERLSEAVLNDRAEEAVGLSEAINLNVKDIVHVNVPKMRAGTYLSTGGIEKVQDILNSYEYEDEDDGAEDDHNEFGDAAPQGEFDGIDIIYFDGMLSPVQQRNLEREWKTKVIDRTALILEIFGARAQTKEGKLQVEHAALSYQKSRLVRSWTHLERQRGGAGFMGGPGETQIEIDRRIIGDRINQIKKEINQLKKNRDLQRKSRERVPFPIVALVGYTNAGKSTLFNKLTGANIFAEDLLFATLDTTMRKVEMPSGQNIILSDTVGFISNLPTQLIAAFRATLEQVEYADVILHVEDISNPQHDQQREDVLTILKDLGVDADHSEHIITIHNKIDNLDEDDREFILNRAARTDDVVAISARSGQGLDVLLNAIEAKLQKAHFVTHFELAQNDGKALSWLHENAEVKAVSYEGDMTLVKVFIDKPRLDQFEKAFRYNHMS